MSWFKRLFGSEHTSGSAAGSATAKRASSNDLDWLNSQVQAQIRQRAQSPISGEDERTAQQLASLYKDYDKVCNHRTDQEKAECEKINAVAADIGRVLCDAGGPKKMLLVAFRAERY